MGNGTQARLNELGLIPRQIEGLLLTHHHLDHNEEFGPLLMHSRMMGAKPEIAGPPTTQKLVDFTLDFYAEDIAYRLGRLGRTMRDFDHPTARELQGGERFPLGGMQVSTTRVDHTIQTVAYRFDADGQSIVISGDLSYTESLIELAHAADVLVIDSGAAIVRQGQAVSAGRPGGPGARRVPAGAAVSIRTARSRMWSPWPASPAKTSRAHAHRSGRGRRGGNDCSHQKNVFGRGHRRLRPAGDSGQRPAAAVGQRRRAARDGVLDPSRFRGHDNRSRQDHRLARVYVRAAPRRAATARVGPRPCLRSRRPSIALPERAAAKCGWPRAPILPATTATRPFSFAVAWPSMGVSRGLRLGSKNATCSET